MALTSVEDVCRNSKLNTIRVSVAEPHYVTFQYLQSTIRSQVFDFPFKEFYEALGHYVLDTSENSWMHLEVIRTMIYRYENTKTSWHEIEVRLISMFGQILDPAYRALVELRTHINPHGFSGYYIVYDKHMDEMEISFHYEMDRFSQPNPTSLEWTTRLSYLGV